MVVRARSGPPVTRFASAGRRLISENQDFTPHGQKKGRARGIHPGAQTAWTKSTTMRKAAPLGNSVSVLLNCLFATDSPNYTKDPKQRALEWPLKFTKYWRFLWTGKLITDAQSEIPSEKWPREPWLLGSYGCSGTPARHPAALG